jgi:pimeloyl-ACP methyl ester carboxylesterase
MRVLIGLAALALAAAAPAAEPGAVAFESCELNGRGAGARVKAECATLEVPENRAEPGGRRIRLRLARVRSRASRPAPDPVVLLAGGPGQSAVDMYTITQAALRPVLRNRDILMVEQRGTGESNALTCPLPDWKDPATQSLAAVRELARRCVAAYAGRADTRFYTTHDYLRDLEDARAALGIARVNLVGGSYGTRVALEYLRRYPQAVRSAFLASVVPPELALGQDHGTNLEAAVAATAERCSRDVACRDRYGDVRATLRQLQARSRAAQAPVTIRHPQTHALMRAPFNEGALVGVVRLFSYAPQATALLPLLLAEAAAGRPEPLLAQAELLYATVPEQLAHGLELSVICAEDADLLQARPQDRDTLMGSEFVEFVRAQCEVWPHGARPADFHEPVVSATPVLLLSGERDPVTPPRYAEQVARTLTNSRHLVAKGQGHTPLGEGCMPRLLRQFVEQLQPKALDASCLDALGDVPFFLDYQGPGP